MDSKPKLLLLVKLRPKDNDFLQQHFQVKIAQSEVSTVSQQALLKEVVGTDAILCIPRTFINKELLDSAGPSLKVVSTISAGYEHIDLEECRKRKIAVGYLGSLVGGMMAEFTIGLMIASSRRYKEAIRSVDDGSWGKGNYDPAGYLLGVEVQGSTVGFVGFGNIGQNTAKRLSSFNVKKMLYCGPNRKIAGDELGVEYVSLEELLKQSDFVVASCTSNETTRGMFNKKTFGLMKATSIFINVARGNLVNQDDLYEALSTKQIWAAGLDTVTPEPIPHQHPLVKLPNCLILPHIGTSSEPLRSEMIETAISNLLAGIRNQKMPIPLLSP